MAESSLDTPVNGKQRRFINLDDETIGRVAERIARFFGSGTYLMYQTIVVIVWILLNIGGFWWNWDPYPFILLNLAFSTQAAYAAPLILLAQNRQEDRDQIAVAADRRRAQETKADTEFLARELASMRLTVGDLVTRDYLRHELEDVRNLLERVEAKLDDFSADQADNVTEPTQGDVDS